MEGHSVGGTLSANAYDLAATLGRQMEGEVQADEYTRHMYATDASMYAITPLAVAFPRHVDDIVAAVETARKLNVPVLPRGGGTSHCGQTVGEAIVLDCSRYMSAITSLDPEAKTATVQPGVVQDDLNQAAAPHGLLFAPDTSTANRATLGGMIGNNSCGSRSARYGMTIDHVRSLDVVLSDGSRARLEPLDKATAQARGRRSGIEGMLYQQLPALAQSHAGAIRAHTEPFWRRAGGYRMERLLDDPYNLAPFVVGSEGTLVCVTEAEVDLVEQPKAIAMGVGHFTSTQAAIDATHDAMESGAAAIEMVDRFILDLARNSPEHRHLFDSLEGAPDALMFVECYGDSDAEAHASLEKLAERWKRNGHGYAFIPANSPQRQQRLRGLRKAGLGLLMNAGKGTERSVAFVEDTAVPPEHLAAYTERFADVLDRHGLRAGFYGHASAGCLHVRPFMNLTAEGGVAVLRSVAEEVQELVTEYGGTNSSEHGDGLVRSEFNEKIFGPELYGAMRQVKQVFDPDGRMNPGKKVDAAPMTENLREPALPVVTPMPTHYDFGEGGLRGAADTCQRIGVCRKGPDAGGAMCPSFMATRNEEDSTRGRAMALVHAMSSPDPKAALGDERLHEVLDLCLQCKACASECPLGVDMATMKSEALAQRHEQDGVPLRSRVFGNVRSLYRMGARTSPLTNWIAGLKPVRTVLERRVAISAQRPMPQFAAQTLPAWFQKRSAPTGDAPRGEVVLLADSFTSFTEPSIGIAAVEVLEAAGHRVHLETLGCCGRAQISKGLVAEAKDLAEDLHERVAPFAQRGVPIVGVEPSCVLTLADEHPRLLGATDPAVQAVAASARMIEDLLVEALDDGSLVLDQNGPTAGRTVLYHAHCHQRAAVGTTAAAALLAHLPAEEIVMPDAGCCGMAGSFGFEREHYDLSMQIGNQRLLPAVRELDREAVVAASGVSCRQQISHGAERAPLHPVQLVRDGLLRT